nr:Growth arrest and DNA damage-inducible proteins-interacting protein like [Ipomoea batatas]
MADGYNNSSHSSSQPPLLSLHLCFFLLILFTFVSITWYINYESIFEGIMEQIKLLLMISPLLLLLVVHLLSTLEKSSVFFFPVPQRDSIHRAGGTPWGVALLLVLLLFMISYQSDFRERWFPLLAR